MVNKNADLQKRKYVIGGIACLIILIFIIKLFLLQIMSSEYKVYADNNAFYRRVLYPARGTISDRNNKLLVINQPTYDILYMPREIKNLDTLSFCEILGITKQQFDKRMAEIKDFRLNPGYSSYTLQTFMTQLNVKESSMLQEKLYKFPGVFIQNRTIRQYKYPNVGLLLGYVAEVNQNQLDKDSYYARGDYAGISGIEASYEKFLRGEKGVEILLKDAHGRTQGKYDHGKEDIAPQSGKNLKLSIDIDVQAYGEYLLKNKVGAIVMIEPKTGEILSLVTSPSYDPSMLLGRKFSDSYTQLERNPLKPLYNRAIQGLYPPGSTFKTAQGLTFLQEGIIDKNTLFACHGGYPPLGGHPKCHMHPSPVNLETAVAISCNSYFSYGLNTMLMNRIKYNSIQDAFEVWKKHIVKMGFGYQLGIDIPSEKRGFIPNSKFYDKAFKTKNWVAANVISIAIGQGEILTTPLQMANLASSLANRGYYITPHVVKQIQDTILDSKYTEKHFTGIDKSNYDLIIDGMTRSVSEGTCRGVNLLPDIQVCGKTGTAQNPHGRDHSIFMGFAPKENPKVAIFVVVENAGFGASFAVPTARLMLEKYLKRKIPDQDKYIENRIANTVILPQTVVFKKKNISND